MKLLLTADMHLREDVPTCRTDDYLAEQERKLSFIRRLSIERNALWLDGGDIFDHWKPSPALLVKAISLLRSDGRPIFSVPGNHDLPQHNFELVRNTGFGVLQEAGSVVWLGSIPLENSCIVTLVPWGCKVPEDVLPKHKDKFRILVYHHLVYQEKEPYPGADRDGSKATKLLAKYKNYDLIVTGHNHQTVLDCHNTRWLINPGSMMRMTAAQIDHKPCVFIFDTERAKDFYYKPEQIFIPIKENVVSREHIEVSEYKDARINAFIERLNNEVELKMSFTENLNRYMSENTVREATKKIVWQSLEKK